MLELADCRVCTDITNGEPEPLQKASMVSRGFPCVDVCGPRTYAARVEARDCIANDYHTTGAAYKAGNQHHKVEQIPNKWGENVRRDIAVH